MMDRGLKVVLAMSVLLGGTAAALLFRRTPTPPGPPPHSIPPLVLRDRGPAADESFRGAPTAQIESSRPGPPAVKASARPPSVLAPLDPGAPPPVMAKSYPLSAPEATPRWGTSMALGPAGGADRENTPRTHRIADGDTLEMLAERYLGSGDLAMEIYQANRYVLPGPTVLPIGVELKIPPRPRRAAPSVDPAARGPLVPVPPNSLRGPQATPARARGTAALSDGDR